ncbi:hypothetical protein SAMN04487946_101578 [Halobellus clavatus]|uniref:Uncharacterized protein n=1 Tax=Halobellus clavatus TaxID=660517 RepID=A0A1H3DHK5_9EURY|nr:hypothetical protein SAMN04487946_101578 [Halobellus clavatus]
MLTDQKLWLFTAAVGGVRIAQGYWKISAPLTLFCILMYFKRRENPTKII